MLSLGNSLVCFFHPLSVFNLVYCRANVGLWKSLQPLAFSFHLPVMSFKYEGLLERLSLSLPGPCAASLLGWAPPSGPPNPPSTNPETLSGYFQRSQNLFHLPSSFPPIIHSSLPVLMQGHLQRGKAIPKSCMTAVTYKSTWMSELSLFSDGLSSLFLCLFLFHFP